MNKKIYIIGFEGHGEFQAVFDENFKCISGWDRNDANWRNEYFSHFMNELGINVLTKLPKEANKERLEKVAYKEVYGDEMPE